MLILVPFYYIFPSILLLFIYQSFILSLGIIATYLIVLHRTEDINLSLFLASLYTFSPLIRILSKILTKRIYKKIKIIKNTAAIFLIGLDAYLIYYLSKVIIFNSFSLGTFFIDINTIFSINFIDNFINNFQRSVYKVLALSQILFNI